VTACAVLMAVGCKISKQVNGQDKKVSIEGPGASLHVDTTTTASDSGLPIYPGAKELPNTASENNHKHVDINTFFGTIKVVKLRYTSDDVPERVTAFYRGKLASYGKVLECKGAGQEVVVPNVGDMDRPVACSNHGGASGGASLKVGAQGNQRTVRIRPGEKGTQFELLYVQIGDQKSNSYGNKQPS